MLHTTLSKGKHIAQRKGKDLLEPQVKGTGNIYMNDCCIVLEVHEKKGQQAYYKSQSERDKVIADPGQRQGY